MNCTEFETRLNELLDQRRSLTGDRLLAEHATGCAECAQLAAEYSILVATMAKLPQEAFLSEKSLRPEFSLEVLKSLELREVGQAGWSRKKVLRSAAIAMAAAAAVLVAVMNWPRPEGDGQLPGGTTTVATTSSQSILLAGEWELLVRDAAAERMGWMGDVAEGFRPVTQSLYSALNALRRALPGQMAPVHSSIEDQRSSLVARELEVLV